MLPVDSLFYIQELINEGKSYNRYDGRAYEISQKIDKKINEIIYTMPLGQMSKTLLHNANEHYFQGFGRPWTKIKEWPLYQRLAEYTHAESTDKPKLLQDIEIEISQRKKLSRNKSLIKVIYLCEYPELIDLFFRKFPIPPLSLFETHNQPKVLIEREKAKNVSVMEFSRRNEGDNKLVNKVVFLQRHIRGTLRQEMEVQRLGTRYFASDPEKSEKAKQLIVDANTPYRPQKCSAELAERIMQTTSKLELYSSVVHLLCAENIAPIVDGCLYGRENLENLYMTYRPAALTKSDASNGDENAICLGPNKIDPMCLEGRTVGLELDLRLLTAQDGLNHNPTIFFKQKDFGLKTDWQDISIGTKSLEICHENGYFRVGLRINDHANSYIGEILFDMIISYNMPQMHQILVLNFFRFLDQLKDFGSNLALDKINEIYAEIEKLNDYELSQFLMDLGKKMSYTSEFNFYGAYQIDLNSLISIAVYKEHDKIAVIKTSELIHELNNGFLVLYKCLKEKVPELFNSVRFMEHLYAKITNKEALKTLQHSF